METETPNNGASLILEQRAQDAGYYRLTVSGERVWLLGSELQALVQAAYDQAGLMAVPAYDLEAEAATDALRDEAESYTDELMRRGVL